MKLIPIYYGLLCLFFMTFTGAERDHVADAIQIDERLLYGKWKLTDTRGYGDLTGDISGTFLFTGEESDATLTFPTGVLAGGVFRDGGLYGTMTYEPGDLGLPEGSYVWDNLLPNGAWTLTGEYLYIEGGIYGDFDGLIDELTEDTFILTGRSAHMQLISNPGGNKATVDGVFTFTFVK